MNHGKSRTKGQNLLASDMAYNEFYTPNSSIHGYEKESKAVRPGSTGGRPLHDITAGKSSNGHDHSGGASRNEPLGATPKIARAPSSQTKDRNNESLALGPSKNRPPDIASTQVQPAKSTYEHLGARPKDNRTADKDARAIALGPPESRQCRPPPEPIPDSTENRAAGNIATDFQFSGAINGKGGYEQLGATPRDIQTPADSQAKIAISSGSSVLSRYERLRILARSWESSRDAEIEACKVDSSGAPGSESPQKQLLPGATYVKFSIGPEDDEDAIYKKYMELAHAPTLDWVIAMKSERPDAIPYPAPRSKVDLKNRATDGTAPVEPVSSLVVAGRYELQCKVGSGQFGFVYLALDRQTQDTVAVKLEPLDSDNRQQLAKEIEAYQQLGDGGRGVPDLKDSGSDANFNFLVLDALGPSLTVMLNVTSELRKRMDSKKKKTPGTKRSRRYFELKTVLMLAEQFISRLQHVHSMGLVHNDVKPDNFAMGWDDPFLVYIIDFGLTRRFVDKETQQHVPLQDGQPLRGTALFASINSQQGLQTSRRDDLESLGYILVYLLKGDLPWKSVITKNAHLPKEEMRALVLQAKLSTDLRDLCHGLYPAFEAYLTYCRALSFAQKPDYDRLRQLFREVLRLNEFDDDGDFDWVRLTQGRRHERRLAGSHGHGASGARYGAATFCHSGRIKEPRGTDNEMSGSPVLSIDEIYSLEELPIPEEVPELQDLQVAQEQQLQAPEEQVPGGEKS